MCTNYIYFGSGSWSFVFFDSSPKHFFFNYFLTFYINDFINIRKNIQDGKKKTLICCSKEGRHLIRPLCRPHNKNKEFIKIVVVLTMPVQ